MDTNVDEINVQTINYLGQILNDVIVQSNGQGNAFAISPNDMDTGHSVMRINAEQFSNSVELVVQ